jgi:proline iminopeptidase
MPPEDTTLHPHIEAYDHGWLEVGDGHAMYFEQGGTPQGIPALVLHGGPGSGSSPAQRRFFDPARYRIIQFDQRGCGRSTPRGELRANSTPHLLADIERLRAHLGIARWLVVGGSWGASLALAYCAGHKEACLGALLRGVFLTGAADLRWFFAEAGQLLPEAFDTFTMAAPHRARRDMLGWLARVLERGSADEQWAAVCAWMAWENALSTPVPAPTAAAPDYDAQTRARLLDKYRLQARYLARRCDLGEARLLDCAARMHGLPTAILHGRLDHVCRPANAWRIHRTLQGSRLAMIAQAGHNPFEPPMASAMTDALAHFAQHASFACWPSGPG